MGVDQETGAQRQQRADAARNRERVLAVAGELLRERGLDASVGEIAERAGVGRATLFRNFPTKRDLILAVVIGRIQEALAEGRAMLDSAGDEEILFPFMKNLIGLQSMDRGLFEAVGSETLLTDARGQRAFAAIAELIDDLIAHDQKLGYVRPGLSAVDMLMLVKGACAVATSMGDMGPQALERHLSLVRNAIAAPGHEHPLEGAAPSFDDLRAAPSAGVSDV